MKFPKELFVVIEKTDNSEYCLLAETDPKQFAVCDETRSVARYKLVETGEVVNKSQYIKRT